MTVAERMNAERMVLAGWSRAILLQLAHPLVAQGVADHSSFANADRGTQNATGKAERRAVGSLLVAAVRLHHTVQAMRRLTFGDASQSQAALDGIKAIHRRVNGTLPAAVGCYPAGAPYSAEDASLVLWVHATLLDSLPLVFSQVVTPLNDEERDAWCRESAPVARALGAGSDVPETWEALQSYLSSMLASGRIEVSGTARALAHDVLAPPLSWVISPLRAVNRTLTVGMLPPVIRTQYGFAWAAADEARLTRTLRGLRALRKAMPDAIAQWPDARRKRA